MKKYSKFLALLLSGVMLISLSACASAGSGDESSEATEETTETSSGSEASDEAQQSSSSEVLTDASEIEAALDLSNMNAEWSYNEDSDSWTMSPVTAVANPEIEDEQGVSECVPGAYVKGIDTDGDGEADVTDESANGDLVIDNEASITSTNGQIYTGTTAPVIVNTGAAGYSEQQNQNAASTYAADGYINVACGNRGKQSTVTDEDGNNIVELYDPVYYIGAEGTNDPTWTRILMGASEGDISMLNSLNLEIAWLNAGTDAVIEWQWDGGHVPSEILGDSLSLYVDMMYGKYVDGAEEITKSGDAQTENGDATEATGTDISGWVGYDENGVSFGLADIASYRTSGASKAMPGFDVMDYGQEDYVFGSSEKDARHWDKYVLKVFEENEETLSDLFNAG